MKKNNIVRGVEIDALSYQVLEVVKTMILLKHYLIRIIV